MRVERGPLSIRAGKVGDGGKVSSLQALIKIELMSKGISDIR